MKKFFLAMLIFSAVFLGQVREDVINNELVVHANVINAGSRDADGLRLTVYIPELGVFQRTGKFDLGDGEKAGKFVFTAINAPKGAYFTKITLSSSDKGLLDTRYAYTII